MPKTDDFISFIKKILPDEESIEDKIEEFASKLALKKPEKTDKGYLLIDPIEDRNNGSYRAEKISAKRERKEPYGTFDKMRAIGKKPDKYGSWYISDKRAFIEQAEFMKDFTDDFNEIIPFDVHYPAYDIMDDRQLRTYFTWRTEARKGNVKNVSMAYALCFTYELLNEIGTDSPESTMDKLIALWTDFRNFDSRLDNYMRNWTRDFYIVHNKEISVPFLIYRDKFPVPYEDFDVELFSKLVTFKWDNLKAIELFSTFKITEGQFYRSGNQKIIESCACFVFREISKYFKSQGTDIKKLFTTKIRNEIYSFYRGAMTSNVNCYDTVVELDGIEIFRYNGKRYCIESPDLSRYNSVVGYILKLIEVNMRTQFGCKKNLQPPAIKNVEKCFFDNKKKYKWYSVSGDLTDLSIWRRKMLETMYDDSFEQVIENAIKEYIKQADIVIKNGKIDVIKPFEIDLSKLKKIEKDHIETAKKLILEDEPAKEDYKNIQTDIAAINLQNHDMEKADEADDLETDEPDIALSGIERVMESLSDAARSLILCLVSNEKAGSNPELLVEEINEKAFEIIGDNLIEYVLGEPEIYEDYIIEVNKYLEGSNECN